HIVLTRELAEAGHFPAIDIEASVSRVLPDIIDADHLQMVRRVRGLYSLYQQNKDLISVGAYKPGSNPNIDLAIEKIASIRAFLQQDMEEAVDLSRSILELSDLLGEMRSKTE